MQSNAPAAPPKRANIPMWALVVGALVLIALVAFIDLKSVHLSGIRLLYVLPLWILIRTSGIKVGLLLACGVLVVIATTDLTHNAVGSFVPSGIAWFVSLVVVSVVIARVEDRLAEARRQSLHDPLTKILNRRGLEAQVELAVARAAPKGTRVALALIDCDKFKEINDQHGHVFGDQVLCALGTNLSRASGLDGSVGRLGGDEFAVLFVGLPDSAVRFMLIEARLRFSNQMKERGCDCSFSFGLATDLDAPLSFLGLLQAADERMYCQRRLPKTPLGAVARPEPLKPDLARRAGHRSEAVHQTADR